MVQLVSVAEEADFYLVGLEILKTHYEWYD